uniref:Uncharacterized protein n=1 Tax=Cacopsylla melanoneura TaxID=428564 RepID=A0A8D8QND4_9HEMI
MILRSARNGTFPSKSDVATCRSTALGSIGTTLPEFPNELGCQLKISTGPCSKNWPTLISTIHSNIRQSLCLNSSPPPPPTTIPLLSWIGTPTTVINDGHRITVGICLKGKTCLFSWT